MSLTEIRNSIVLYGNPEFKDPTGNPSTSMKNISALFLPEDKGVYSDRITSNLTTLANNNERASAVLGGMLFVPQVTSLPSCDVQQYDFIPRNVTRREQLPERLTVIAIAPWFNIDCTMAYLASARRSSVNAFIFYKPNNSTNKPQEADSPVWNLNNSGGRLKKNPFPIFAIPGIEGFRIMTQLSLYSGDGFNVPYSEKIMQRENIHQSDYIRVWTEIVLKSQTNLPAVWAFVVIVIGALLLTIGTVSLAMHLIQRRNRNLLQRRVQCGEVDLEAMGVKRLTVPPSHVKDFPLYTYNAEPELAALQMAPASSQDKKVSRKRRRWGQRSVAPALASHGSGRSAQSTRSKHSLATGAGDATATNFQPNCQICLGSFEHRITIIRELPCGHIFHPECVDEFLTQNSSLCPMCKHCMLPWGYSPKITNGMVRRERAVRRLRQRVDLDDSSLESGEQKQRSWGRRIFSPLGSAPAPAGTGADEDGQVTELSPQTIISGAEQVAREGKTLPEKPPSAAVAPRQASRRRRRARANLQPLPTHQEDEAVEVKGMGRASPSSFARKRMKEIAAKNAPFDDPDRPPAKWRQIFSKAFPGFT